MGSCAQGNPPHEDRNGATVDVGLDQPCVAEFPDGRNRSVSPDVERAADVVDTFVNWDDAEAVTQGVAYDFTTQRLVVAFNPTAALTKRSETQDHIMGALADPSEDHPDVPIVFRVGCYPTSELAETNERLIAGDWLDAVGAAFVVSYDADDGRLRLEVEQRGLARAKEARDLYAPYVKLVTPA